jgi:hypothetical protein
MRALSSGLVLALALVLGGSIATAAPQTASRPGKKAKRPVKVEPPPAVEAAGNDANDDADRDTKKVALENRDAEIDMAVELDDKGASRAPEKLVKAEPAKADRGWQVEIGPYLWASSVDANVSFGPLAMGGPVSAGTLSAGANIGFITLARHSRYGAELLAEVRHGRFSLSGDLMYGVAAVTGSTDIASVMVTLTGNASSLLVDGAAGYQVLGDDDSVFSLEARAGVRYQRTVVNGELNVAGFTLQSPEATDDAADVVAGSRAVVRPARWFFLSGMFDTGVVGASSSTWSASVDAGLRVSSRVLVTAGWRTLTLDRPHLSLVLQGPRAAVQLVF